MLKGNTMKLMSTVLLAATIFVMGNAVAGLQISDAKAYPDKIVMVNGHAREMVLDVTVQSHGIPDFDGCVIMLDFGDGQYGPDFFFKASGVRRTSYRHSYTAPGDYTVVARGKGSNGCQGERRVVVHVTSADGVGVATADESASCPAGWSIVPKSQSGNRFTCMATPPAQPIACTGSTKYFQGNGVIGCR
jgi:hypothetical protein